MPYIQTQLTVSIHELISWALVIISFMLWWHERKINNNMQHYMVIQGILQHLKEKVKYYAHLIGEINRNDIIPDKAQFRMLSNSVYTDHVAMMQSLTGILKSFQLKKELPFDVDEFVKRESSPSQDQAAR